MSGILFEVKIKRGTTTLVLPDSLTIGMTQDRISALLANVVIPGDEVIIKIWNKTERD